MLVHWVCVSTKAAFWWPPPKRGLINFCLLTFSCLVFNRSPLPYHVTPPTAPKLKSTPPFHRVSALGTSACSVHAYTIFGPSVFPDHFNYLECFGLTIWGLSALFIYLFIDFQIYLSRSITLHVVQMVSILPLISCFLKNISWY